VQKTKIGTNASYRNKVASVPIFRKNISKVNGR